MGKSGQRSADTGNAACDRPWIPLHSPQMIRFRLFDFQILIHWFFWVNCALLGGALEADSPERMQALIGWLLMAAVSVLIHELGHALVMRHYGDRQVGIVLYAFGGLARGSRWLSRRENVAMSLAGPLLQLTAGVAMHGLLSVWHPSWPVGHYVLVVFRDISLFWALLNLLPIMPLDGGHITSALLGPARRIWALKLSLACSVLMALVAFQFLGLVSVLFFGLFAWNNFKELRGEPQVQWMETR